MTKRILSRLTRLPRSTKRAKTAQYKELLDETMELKRRTLEELNATEDLETYSKLIKEYYKTLDLISRCKGSLKSNLRVNK